MSGTTHVILLDYVQREKNCQISSFEFLSSSALQLTSHELAGMEGLEKYEKLVPISEQPHGPKKPEVPSVLKLEVPDKNPFNDPKIVAKSKFLPKVLTSELFGLSEESLTDLSISLDSQERQITRISCSAFGEVTAKPPPPPPAPEVKEPEQAATPPAEVPSEQPAPDQMPAGVEAKPTPSEQEKTEETPDKPVVEENKMEVSILKSEPETAPTEPSSIDPETDKSVLTADANPEDTKQDEVKPEDPKTTEGEEPEAPKTEEPAAEGVKPNDAKPEESLSEVKKPAEVVAPEAPPKRQPVYIGLERVKELKSDHSRLLMFSPVCQLAPGSDRASRVEYIEPWTIIVLMIVPEYVYAEDMLAEMTILDKFLSQTNWSGDHEQEYQIYSERTYDIRNSGVVYKESWLFAEDQTQPKAEEQPAEEAQEDETPQNQGKNKKKNKNKKNKQGKNQGAEIQAQPQTRKPIGEETMDEATPTDAQVEDPEEKRWQEELFQKSLFEKLSGFQNLVKLCEAYSKVYYHLMNPNIDWVKEQRTNQQGDGEKQKGGKRKNRGANQMEEVKYIPVYRGELEGLLERLYYASFTEEKEKNILRSFEHHSMTDAMKFFSLPQSVRDYLCNGTQVEQTVINLISNRDFVSSINLRIAPGSSSSKQLLCLPTTGFTNFMLHPRMAPKRLLFSWVKAVEYITKPKEPSDKPGPKEKLVTEQVLKLLAFLHCIIQKYPTPHLLFKKHESEIQLVQCLGSLVTLVHGQSNQTGWLMYQKILHHLWPPVFTTAKAQLFRLPLTKTQDQPYCLKQMVNSTFLRDLTEDNVVEKQAKQEILSEYLKDNELKESNVVKEFVLETLRRKSPMVVHTFKEIDNVWWRKQIPLNNDPVGLIPKILQVLSNENIRALLLEIHSFLTTMSAKDPEVYKHNVETVTHKVNPFYKLYTILTEVFPKAFEDDRLAVNLLVVNGPLNHELVDKFLIVLWPEVKTNLFRVRIQIKEMREDLKRQSDRLGEFVILPQTELTKVKFLLQARDELNKLLTDMDSMQLKDLKASEFRSDIKIMDDAVWGELPLYYKFLPTQAQVLKLVQSSNSLAELRPKLMQYIESTTKMFEGFTNPANFSRAAWVSYLRYAHLADDERGQGIFGYSYYTKFLKELRLSKGKDTVTQILENAKRFASIAWVVENYPGLEKLLKQQDLRLLSIHQGELFNILASIYNSFSKLADTDALLSIALGFDPKTKVLDDVIYQKGTKLVSIISQAPKTVKFIKEQRKEDIRTMRDDCDTVDTGLVNKLEFFNAHLRKIVEYPIKLDTDVLMQVLSQLDYKDQTKLIETTLDIEKMTEHLAYIFEKAKKSSNFAKKQVEMINKESLLTIKYSPQLEAFEIDAKLIAEHQTAGKKDETISPLELKELFNQIRILSIGTDLSLQTAGDDGEMAVKNTNFPDFISLADELEKLLKTIDRLRDLGVMDVAFTKPIEALLQKQAQHVFKLSPDCTRLEIYYSSRDLRRLKDSNRDLTQKTNELHEKLVKEYSDWSLLTFYHGKRLFHLTEFFGGNLNDRLLREQVINQMYESIEVRELEDMITQRKDSSGLLENDFISRFEQVAKLMRDKTEAAMRGLNLNKTDSKDSVFGTLGRTVKIVQNSMINPKVSKDSPDEVSEYEWILRLLHLANKKVQNFLKMSQILFCDSKTNSYEVRAYVTRALLDPIQQEYFVLNLADLQPDTFKTFKQEVDRLHQQHKDVFNPKLFIFLNNELQLEELRYECNAFEILSADVWQKVAQVNLQTLTQKANYRSIFALNKMVLSEMAGMGKTLYIHNESHRCERVEVFLAGEISSTIIMSRMTECIRQLDKPGQLVLIIKLEHMDRFEELVSLIDFTLFKICFLGRISSDYGCLKFKETLHKIYIEVGNTMQAQFRKHSKILRLLEKSDSRETPLVMRMPEFKLERILYVQDKASDEQRALNLLYLLPQLRISKSLTAPQQRLSEEECRQIIRERFLHNGRKESTVTFSQYKFWIKLLARLARGLDECRELNHAGTPENQRLRGEVAEEIYLLSDAICGFTVEQAKTSQQGMIALSKKSGDYGHEYTIQLESLKRRTEGLQKWDSSKMLIPLMSQHTVILLKSADKLLNNPQDKFRYNLRRQMMVYLDNKTWYKEVVENGVKLLKEVQYLRMLAHYLGCQPEELIQRCNNFRTKGFVITLDNLMKLGLILIKSQLDVPIILMGESGCGKSYLTEFIAVTLLQDQIEILTLYSGLTIIELLEFMTNCIKKAKSLGTQGKKLWIFFDEFNTSALQSVVGEIMIDRYCSVGAEDIRQIPPNIVFIAACNPYRLKVKQNNVGLVPKSEDTMLSHRVFPIPERILNYIWDFGQLSDDDERKYAINIISKANLFADLPERDRKTHHEKFAGVAYNCHRNIKKSDELSAMSLRDLNRVAKTYSWFRAIYQEIDRLGIDKITDQINRVQSTICSLMLCYGLRLNGQPERQKQFIDELCKQLKEIHTFSNKKPEEILNTLPEFVEKYLFKELRSLTGIHPIIPDDVASNRPLKENFIAMLVGYDKLLPVIICGSPGTSKTLCTQILTQALSPEVRDHPKAQLFKRFKSMFSIYYGGSQTSTAEGVKLVFERGRKYLSNNQSTETPTVLFDEIGLAELSPHNPLKVLHPLLENQDKKGHEIAFIGLSNWTLDLSKMNRLIYVARADLEISDLTAIFKNSIAKLTDSPEKQMFMQALEVLAKSYFDFRKWQTNKATKIAHKNFHGSRDIYAVAKFIYRKVIEKQVITEDTIPRLIKQAIERNFSGDFYPFGQMGWTAQASVPGLEREAPMPPIERVKFSNLKSIDGIRELCQRTTPSREEPVTFLTSSGVFKRFFLQNMDEKKLKMKVRRSDFLEEMHTMTLVDQNLLDKHSRFLMLKSESDLVDTMLVEKLKRMVQTKPELECYKIKTTQGSTERVSSKVIDWRGVENQENSLELLSTLKTYISEGYIVVMKNLDGLYGSLYDLFNQKYTVVEGQKSCFLYYGESKQKVNVHDNFKCIVIIPTNPSGKDAKEDIELKQPAPFLNRFEKFYVRIASLLQHSTVRRLLALHKASMDLALNPKHSFVGLSSELMASICISLEDLSSGDALSEEVQITQEETERIPNDHLKKVLQMSTNLIFLDADLSKEKYQLLKEAHPFKSLLDLAKYCDTQLFAQWFVFTFSSTEVFNSQVKLINQHVEKRAQEQRWVTVNFDELSDKGVEARGQFLKSLKGNIIVQVPSVSMDHFELLNQLKAIVTDNMYVTAMIVVIQLDRDLQKFDKYSSIGSVDFWNGWENIVMDDLEYNDYAAMYEVLNKPPLDMLRVDHNPFIDPEEVNQLSTRVFNKVIQQPLLAVADEFNDEGLMECKEYVIEFLHKHPEIVVKFKDSLSECTNPDSPLFDPRFHLDTCREFLRKIPLSKGTPKLINIEIGLQILLKSIASKVMKDLWKHLNHHLANLFSYAKGCCSEEENVRKMFELHLSESLAKWNAKDPLKNMPKNVHMELPMIRDDPEFRGLLSALKKIVSKKTDEKAVMVELICKVRLDEEKLMLEENIQDVEILAGDILRGQKHIMETYFSQFDEYESTFEEYFDERGIRFSRSSCLAGIVFDLLRAFHDQPEHLLYLKSMRHFEPMFEFLQFITPKKNKTSLKYLLFAYMYIFIGAQDGLRDLCKVASDRGLTLRGSLTFTSDDDEDDMEEQSSAMQKRKILNRLLVKGFRLYESLTSVTLQFASSIDKNQMYNRLRLSLTGNKAVESLNLASLLILEAIKGLKLDAKSESEIRELNSLKTEIGEKAYIHRVRTDLPKFLPRLDLIKNHDKIRQIVNILCEYGYMCGLDYNLDFFIDGRSNDLFNCLTPLDLECYINSLLSGIMQADGHGLVNRFSSPSEIRNLPATISSDRHLQRLGEYLAKIRDGDYSRYDAFQKMFVDRVVLERQKGLAGNLSGEMKAATIQEVMKHLKTDNPLPAFLLMILVGVTRSLFTSEYFTEHKTLEAHSFRQIEEISRELGPMATPDQMVKSELNYIRTFFMQAAHLYGQPSALARHYKLLADFVILEQTVKAGPQKLSFLSEQLTTLCNKIEGLAQGMLFDFEKQPLKVTELSALLKSNNVSMYVFAICLINKFVLDTATTLEATYRERFGNLVAALDLSEQVTQFLDLIIEGDSFDFSEFLQDGDTNVAVNLKRLFYQHLAVQVCFASQLPHATQAVVTGTGLSEISNAGFFATVVSEKKVENLCSVVKQVITYRLRELRWTPTDPRLPDNTTHPRLGTYRCSCGYAYGLSDCGFPNGVFPCGWCGSSIGGIYPNMVARPGHIQIENFPTAQTYIMQEYDTRAHKYNAHKIVDIHDSILIPLKLKEVGVEAFVRNFQNDKYLNFLGLKIIFRHLLDHLSLITKKVQLSGETLKVFEDTLTRVVDLNRPEIATMANRRIDSPLKYVLAHIKNDIQVLKNHLKLRNGTDACNWVSGMMSLYVENQLANNPGAINPKPNIPDTYLETPLSLLTLQQEMINKMTAVDLAGADGLFRIIVHNQLSGEALLKGLKTMGVSPNILKLSKVMRHNYTDKAQMLSAFQDKCTTASDLIYDISKYESLMKDFSDIVMSIWNLVKLIARRYNNQLNFEQASSKTIGETEDEEIIKAFDTFIEMWEPRSPLRTHIDNFSEIFSFAYMCQQDLNVMGWIDRIRRQKHNSTLINFMLVSTKEFEDKELLHMKSVIRTIIGNMQNKFVAKIDKILGIDEKYTDKKSLSQLQREDLLPQMSLEELISQHYWFSTETLKETTLVFDMPRIELSLAKLLKRPMFKVDEEDLPHFNFRSAETKATTNQAILTKLFAHIKEVDLPDTIIKEINKKAQPDLEEILTYLLDLAEVIYNRYKFTKPEVKLQALMEELMNDISSPLDSWNFRDLCLNHMKNLYDLCKNSILKLNLENQPEVAFPADFEEGLRTMEDKYLEILLHEMKETLSAYAGEALNQVLSETIDSFLDPESELRTECPEWQVLCKLTFSNIKRIEAEYTNRQNK